MTKFSVSLDDRYRKRDGAILVGGVQALVRLMLLQAERDRKSGLSTAGFVSGYRGSPLGTLDGAFASASRLTGESKIVVQPAVNEELAATAVAGTQQIHQSPGARVNGVFALWYGKGPGLDRAADAIRHGNSQGSSPNGGVVVAVGDDHLAKSSTVACYSDETVASLLLPLLYPADPGEIVSYGLHGFAMSRLTGSWVALKILTEVADSTRTVPATELDEPPILPDVAVPAIGLHNRWPDLPLEQESRQHDYRLPAVLDYVRANGLDRVVMKPPAARVGLIAAGKSWMDLQEALDLLNLDESRLTELGVALYKPAMIWPLEPQGLTAFAAGLSEVVVVEEKAPLIERQVKEILFGRSQAPAVWGKSGPEQRPMFPATSDLTPEQIAIQIASVIARMTGDQAIARGGERWRGELSKPVPTDVPAARRPFFCSGCPHNRSTTVPAGSRALAGIGCHGMAARNRPDTFSYSQMGGEGVHWVGLAPFTDEQHVFSNMGDGTYFHSGLLAIRQAVAVKLNITYKLLYNSAVAMTGGQAIDGELTLERLLQQLRAEGVGTIVLVSDDPASHRRRREIASLSNEITHRDEFDAVQRKLRATQGVSVVVYDQMCATERRRKRKRGQIQEATPRVFINELVCEGCGDCSVKSNCLSVEPVETPFGTKRRINQSSCNSDLSCISGFCPSFVTVEGARVKRVQKVDLTRVDAPPPVATDRLSKRNRVLLAGIGGTGIVTTSAVLAMAGHLDGRETAVLDQIGMAQKGGAVASHVHLGGPIHALRIPAKHCDLLLVCDQVVGNGPEVMASLDTARSRVIANADVAVTGDFVTNRNAIVDPDLLTRRIRSRVAPENFIAFPFTSLAQSLFGDSISANFMMVGLAYQMGWLDLRLEDLQHAIELNGAAKEANLAALEWGRRLAVDPRSVFVAAGKIEERERLSPEAEVERFAAFLRDYQNGDYARRYLDVITRIRASEAAVHAGTSFTLAAARSLFKLMAYKDEYEIARLYTSGEFARAMRSQFDGYDKLSVYLAPPFLARHDKATGAPRKIRFGSWILPVLRLLASLKVLRGTRFDIFGMTSERRTERALIVEFTDVLDRLSAQLTTRSLADAVAIAQMPSEIRGYGHVKQKAVELFRRRIGEALERYQSPQSSPNKPENFARSAAAT
ncbi:indolepyruvate ferredoxin oxidoreductase family protein [Bradyrhizobium liaoningense]|uniref:indolepyruvate ferredoxin oxidoreductase family protein n=1 Tax=Bradyrhizobium liaoningense TaxID=43992 RepID=UPI001BABC6FF|nr:indolepyruvate ferredoxin oxidoreductase family protein [Bradyrhizobium liaoningense]MBR0706985.1 indolepyruvate ferredoxin oxidoreductase family protein [Bradyrhizobium liaoningense]